MSCVEIVSLKNKVFLEACISPDIACFLCLQCIEKMGAGCLTEEQLKELVTILKETLDTHFEKQALRQEQRKDEDFDEDLEETLCDEDDEDTYILSKVSDIMHSLFGVHKTAILPVFEQLLPLFVKLLVSAICYIF